MELSEFLSSFNTELKAELCSLIGMEEISLADIVRKYENLYDIKKNRETIYRALERLVERNILDKKYDKKRKTLVYGLRIHIVVLDFEKNTCEITFKRTARIPKENHSLLIL